MRRNAIRAPLPDSAPRSYAAADAELAALCAEQSLDKTRRPKRRRTTRMRTRLGQTHANVFPTADIGPAPNARTLPQCLNLKAKPHFKKPQKLKKKCGRQSNARAKFKRRKNASGKFKTTAAKKRIPGIGILSIRHAKTAKIWGGKSQSRRPRRNCRRPNSKLRR